jgi:rhamnosyltransferase
MRNTSVWAVVVTYNPAEHITERLVQQLRRQVEGVIIVDNSIDQRSFDWTVHWRQDKVSYVGLGENRGVAAAQNIGIKCAEKNGASHVVLLDQDSEPACDMLAKLLDGMERKEAEGIAVAAVGPKYLDERRNNPPPFIRIRGLGLDRARCDDPQEIVPVDYLISSGCLISVEAIKKIGNMEESLFIDYVDIEWGLRAKVKGFQCFGVCGAKMRHSLGDRPIRLLGKTWPLHAPFRHYYHFRNAVWLYRQEWVPRRWKIVDGYRLIIKYLFYAVIPKDRWAHVRMMSLGIWDAWRGRTGELEEKR